jgi:Putative amidoligase enzyme
MQLQNILNQNSTKTYKIQQLINLGLTRTEITQIIANHYQTPANYGFVQNVYAKMQSQNTLQNNLPQALSFMPSTFNKRFGVEIESYGIEKNNLERALRAAGIAVQSQYYNHDISIHWKIVSDSSINGENSFELVSPVLQGEAGLAELKKVCEVLTRLGAKINKTCGLHIHFEAIDFNLKKRKNLIKKWLPLFRNSHLIPIKLIFNTYLIFLFLSKNLLTILKCNTNHLPKFHNLQHNTKLINLVRFLNHLLS